MKGVYMLLFCLVAGCGGPYYRNVGIGRDVVISPESVERHASKHGVTNAEALAQLKKESDRRRTEDHAAKYGVSEEEAKRQLEYAASTGNRD